MFYSLRYFALCLFFMPIIASQEKHILDLPHEITRAIFQFAEENDVSCPIQIKRVNKEWCNISNTYNNTDASLNELTKEGFATQDTLTLLPFSELTRKAFAQDVEQAVKIFMPGSPLNVYEKNAYLKELYTKSPLIKEYTWYQGNSLQSIAFHIFQNMSQLNMYDGYLQDCCTLLLPDSIHNNTINIIDWHGKTLLSYLLELYETCNTNKYHERLFKELGIALPGNDEPGINISIIHEKINSRLVKQLEEHKHLVREGTYICPSPLWDCITLCINAGGKVPDKFAFKLNDTFIQAYCNKNKKTLNYFAGQIDSKRMLHQFASMLDYVHLDLYLKNIPLAIQNMVQEYVKKHTEGWDNQQVDGKERRHKTESHLFDHFIYERYKDCIYLQDNQGDTPLHNAIKSLNDNSSRDDEELFARRMQFVKKLIEAGSPLLMTNKKGKTPLSYMAKKALKSLLDQCNNIHKEFCSIQKAQQLFLEPCHEHLYDILLMHFPLEVSTIQKISHNTTLTKAWNQVSLQLDGINTLFKAIQEKNEEVCAWLMQHDLLIEQHKEKIYALTKDQIYPEGTYLNRIALASRFQYNIKKDQTWNDNFTYAHECFKAFHSQIENAYYSKTINNYYAENNTKPHKDIEKISFFFKNLHKYHELHLKVNALTAQLDDTQSNVWNGFKPVNILDFNSTAITKRLASPIIELLKKALEMGDFSLVNVNLDTDQKVQLALKAECNKIVRSLSKEYLAQIMEFERQTNAYIERHDFDDEMKDILKGYVETSIRELCSALSFDKKNHKYYYAKLNTETLAPENVLMNTFQLIAGKLNMVISQYIKALHEINLLFSPDDVFAKSLHQEMNDSVLINLYKAQLPEDALSKIQATHSNIKIKFTTYYQDEIKLWRSKLMANLIKAHPELTSEIQAAGDQSLYAISSAFERNRPSLNKMPQMKYELVDQYFKEIIFALPAKSKEIANIYKIDQEKSWIDNFVNCQTISFDTEEDSDKNYICELYQQDANKTDIEHIGIFFNNIDYYTKLYSQLGNCEKYLKCDNSTIDVVRKIEAKLWKEFKDDFFSHTPGTNPFINCYIQLCNRIDGYEKYLTKTNRKTIEQYMGNHTFAPFDKTRMKENIIQKIRILLDKELLQTLSNYEAGNNQAIDTSTNSFEEMTAQLISSEIAFVKNSYPEIFDFENEVMHAIDAWGFDINTTQSLKGALDMHLLLLYAKLYNGEIDEPNPDIFSDIWEQIKNEVAYYTRPKLEKHLAALAKAKKLLYPAMTHEINNAVEKSTHAINTFFSPEGKGTEYENFDTASAELIEQYFTYDALIGKVVPQVTVVQPVPEELDKIEEANNSESDDEEDAMLAQRQNPAPQQIHAPEHSNAVKVEETREYLNSNLTLHQLAAARRARAAENKPNNQTN